MAKKGGSTTLHDGTTIREVKGLEFDGGGEDISHKLNT